MITKLYSVLLLTVSIGLIGCQTTERLTPKIDMIEKDSQAIASKTTPDKIEEKDSDGDGVLDSRDACPGTPINLVVDARGCPTEVELIEEVMNDFRAFYPESSSEPINFDHREINRLAELMQEYDDSMMKIEGHISKYEGREGNKALAKDRAEFIKNYVVLNYDIDPVRILTCDYSYERPIASNDSLEGREMNQRAYLILIGGAVGILDSCR